MFLINKPKFMKFGHLNKSFIFSPHGLEIQSMFPLIESGNFHVVYQYYPSIYLMSKTLEGFKKSLKDSDEDNRYKIAKIDKFLKSYNETLPVNLKDCVNYFVASMYYNLGLKFSTDEVDISKFKELLNIITVGNLLEISDLTLPQREYILDYITELTLKPNRDLTLELMFEYGQYYIDLWKLWDENSEIVKFFVEIYNTSHPLTIIERIFLETIRSVKSRCAIIVDEINIDNITNNNLKDFFNDDEEFEF